MGKRRKNSKKSKRNVIIVVIFFVFCTVGLLVLEIQQIIKKGQNIKKASYNVEQVASNKEEKKENDEIKFDTFVDKTYTQSELKSLTDSQINELLKKQIEVTNEKDLEIEKIVGSASSRKEAINITTAAFSQTNQKVDKVTISKETEKYYVVNVDWSYINQNVSKKYNQKCIVFKDFYYNLDTNILNLDDVQIARQMLDIENYVESYSNNGKRIIQSFIEKEGNRCEYILYYLDVLYGRDDIKDSINLVKEVLSINPATGAIEGSSKDIIKKDITKE